MTTEAALLGLFLSRHPRPYAVSLGVLLTEARQATGRDPRTGRRDHFVFHDDVLALALPGGVAELRGRTAFFWTAP